MNASTNIHTQDNQNHVFALPKTMEAIITTRYGGPEVLQLQQVSRPQPKDNEILIQIHATSVTAAHCMMRTGYPLFGRLFMGLTKPKMTISGTDFAGVVVEAGKNVSKFKVGDEVFGSTDIGGGCYAEYVAVSEEGVLLKKPANLSFEEATAIMDGAMTAFPFLVDQGKIGPNTHILINGASGSIGTAAVQLAKHYGATVTGVCSGRNVDMVRSLGADYVIDYTQEDFTKNGQQYDLIFDTVGKLTFAKTKSSLQANGKFLTPVLSVRDLINSLQTSLFGKKKVIFMATGMRKKEEKISAFQEIRQLLAEEKLIPVLDRMYKLPQVAEAQRYVEKGHKRGNVVVQMGK